MKITAELLAKWRHQGKDRDLRQHITGDEWEDLCELALKGLAPRPEGREQECPLVVRTALRVLLNHIEPGHWENCRVLVQSWLDGKLDALMQQQLPQPQLQKEEK